MVVLVITAYGSIETAVEAMKLGADDYITKPFNPREVVARVRAVLRRLQGLPVGITESTSLVCGDLRLDIARREVTVGGKSVDLTPTEFELLKIMLENPGYVFTRSTLIERSLGYDYESADRALDTHIKNLRKKIEPDPRQPIYIQTVYGVGYRLEKP